MHAIRQAAFTSVGRASGFAGLAITCLMIGFAYDPSLAGRLGATGALLTAVILALRCEQALHRPYQRTETWIILHNRERPPSALAQQVIGAALREAYAWYGRAAAMVAIVLSAVAPVLSLIAPA